MKDINDFVLSSRIRLARNIEGMPFPMKLSDERASLIIRKVYDALAGTDTYDLYRMSAIDELDGNVLKEKHLISNDLLANNRYGAAVINEAETVSIMVNEEDHIREQCILKGLKLEEAYETVNAVDDRLSEKLKFSYDDKLGYLTSCPTNLGTGLRASVMMFLPGLSITNTLESYVAAVSRLNMTIRGVYGEGSGGEGYLYQLSNQKTLGAGEREIIEAVNSSINHLVEAEERARNALYRSDPDEIKDDVQRAYGILTNAHKLSGKEFMKLMAFVKLGSYYDIIKVTDRARLEKLITDAQPANTEALSGKRDPAERDKFRAAYVAKTLKTIAKR